MLDKRTGRGRPGKRRADRPQDSSSTWVLAGAGGGERPAAGVLLWWRRGLLGAFDALCSPPLEGPAIGLRLAWRFDGDPTAPKQDVHRYIRNRRESPSNIKSMPVFWKNRLYVTLGGDIWWGQEKAWLKRIDATGEGDRTGKAELWSYAPRSPPLFHTGIHDGLVYVADCGGKVHCVDAETGRPYWVHEAGGEIWASTLVADGKKSTYRHPYAVPRAVLVLAAGKEKKVLSSIRLDDEPVYGSAVAARNGTLDVTTMTRLMRSVPRKVVVVRVGKAIHFFSS